MASHLVTFLAFFLCNCEGEVPSTPYCSDEGSILKPPRLISGLTTLLYLVPSFSSRLDSGDWPDMKRAMLRDGRARLIALLRLSRFEDF